MQRGMVERGAISTKLVVLVVLVVAAITGGFVFKNMLDRKAAGPEAAGDTFMSAVTSKDGGTSYNMFSKKAKKQLTSQDWNAWVVFTFDKYAGGQPKLTKQEALPDPGHTYSDSDEAVRLRYGVPLDGKTYQYDIILVQQDGAWRIAEAGPLL